MKKNTIKTKIVIIFALVIIALIAISVILYNTYQEKQLQNRIDTEIAQIEKVEKDFTAKDSRDEKLVVLKALLSDYKKYENAKDSLDEVKTHYKVAIKNIRKHFELEYDKTIEKNTLIDIENITDKDKLNKAKTNLSTLLETITKEVDVVCSSDGLKKYKSKINKLNETYDLRIESINVKENKTKEEQNSNSESSDNTNILNNGSNNDTSNSTPEVSTPAPAPETPSTPSNGGNSNKPWYAGYKKWYSSTGVILYIDQSTGNTYDENGNYLYNVDNPLGG